MKKAIKTIKQLLKVDAEIKAVINLELKAKNFKDQNAEFEEILKEIDTEMSVLTNWSRYDNHASANNINIIFTF